MRKKRLSIKITATDSELEKFKQLIKDKKHSVEYKTKNVNLVRYEDNGTCDVDTVLEIYTNNNAVELLEDLLTIFKYTYCFIEYNFRVFHDLRYARNYIKYNKE